MINAITYLKGDATLPQIPQGDKVIVHVTNTLGTWGKGFVLSLSKRWKKPQIQYKNRKDYVLGDIQIVRVEGNIEVINMIAQNGIKKFYDLPGKRCLDYNALKACLCQVMEYVKEGKTVHMPRIGAGLGGGQWGVIQEIINQTLCKNGIQVFVYDL